METLVGLLVLIIVFAIAYGIVSLMPLEQNIKNIVLLIVLGIMLIYVLVVFLPLLPHPRY